MAFHLRLIRDARNLSLRQLGIRTGLHKSQICRFETGERTPTLLQLRDLATGLQVSVALLVQDELPNLRSLPPWNPEVTAIEGSLVHA